MTTETFTSHIMSHTAANTWWESDVKGIPLCRVCTKCQASRLRSYNPSVLSDEQQEIAFGKVLATVAYDGVDEQVEADY
jgi:hypothetical protein